MSKKKGVPPLLVPVDFSRHSEAALLKACELADCTGQPVVVLHVVHDPAEMPGYYQKIAKKKRLLRIEDMAQEMFDDFLKRLIEENPDAQSLKKAKAMLVTGLPVTRILEVQEKVGASMVVMGSEGRTGMDRLMLGSKAEHIVRLCPAPVLIVKAGAGK